MTHVYKVPKEEPRYSGYSVAADGQPVPVLPVRCSAVPFNRRWPGHQRSIDQSELCGMARFWFEGSVTVSVTADRDFGEAMLRPLSKNVVLSREGRTLTFTLTQPGGYSLELDGYHHNLHIFADRRPEYSADAESPDTLYFGPGYHEAGIVELHSHQTVYLDEGAVVYGCFHAEGCEDIAILGRGILDNSHNQETILFQLAKLGDGTVDVHNSKRENTVQFKSCSHIRLDGFTIRDSLVYNVGLWGCSDIDIRDLRIVGCWRYNSDGIDFHNCRRGTVRGCFIRTFDDTVCYKGHINWPSVCEDILTEDCVVWCDWDHCLEFGAECCADYMRRLTFRNIDVIRSLDVAMNIGNVDYGTICEVLYEDIRVEYDRICPRPQFQASDETVFDTTPDNRWMPDLMDCSIVCHPEYSEGRPERGHIRDVVFRNIHVTSDRMPSSHFSGYDAAHQTENVRIDGLFWNNTRLLDFNSARITVGDFANNITLL